MEPRFAARLFDGVRAAPSAGTVHLRNDALVFTGRDGPVTEWNVARVRSIHRVAGAVQVELDAGHAGPAQQLHVDDLAFEAALDETRGRFDAGLRVGTGAWFRRLGLAGWLTIAAVVVVVAWLALTTLLPHAHVLISREAEKALGDAVVDALAADWRVVEDARFAALAGGMVAELADPAAGFDVRVVLVDEPEPNAFAAPGGRIVVFAGLLDECGSADALAGVLAHEIAHVEQRHSLRQMIRTLGVLFFASSVVGGGVEELATAETVIEMSSLLVVLKHSRDHEREADRIAVGKLRRAGRSAAGLVEFFAGLHAESELERGLAWISTHPTTAERITDLERLAGPPDPTARPWLDDDAWQELRARVRRHAKPR